MTDQPDLDQPCELGADDLNDELTGSAWDLLGQHADKVQILTATSIEPRPEYL